MALTIDSYLCGMNYLSAEEVSKSYGTKVLFNNISFGINKGQKVALVAKNGAGKTSLLRIINGKDTPDKGAVTTRKGISIAYLDQDPDFNLDSTVLETVFNAKSPALNAIREYERCITAQEQEDTEENSEKLQAANAEMDALKAWDYEVKIKQILFKLKITYLDKKISQLSGGQKKRVALSSVLINEPDLLIMDEPTNHLDIEMIEWLEEYLMSKDLTLLVVTHDRYFLDRICDEIIELDNGSLFRYKGNFSYFIEKKAEREFNENSETDKAKNLYRRELEWVRRMPKARGTKSKSRVDAFYVVEEKARKKNQDEKLQLNVKMTRMGGKILELTNINKAFGDFPILKNFSYVFKKNEKIGIVGKNGVGKTTFLNMIMAKEKADAGRIEPGETIVFGYYSQEGLKLNEDKRVIEVVKDIGEFIPLADGSKLSASQLLLRFQFPADIQYNFVSKLSGGEKRKLYLLTILIKNPNFLILDEPTNDLDIITLGILEEFLMEFQGCVLLVTHDRYFMDKLVDHLFIFEGEGNIKDFPGNYTDYRNQQLDSEKEQKQEKPKETKFIAASPEKQEKKKATNKEKFEYESLEKEIAILEAAKTAIIEELNSAGTNHEKLQKMGANLESTIQKLEEKTNRWLELSEIL